MKPTIMHFLYEERVVKGKERRNSITHGLSREKIYRALDVWRGTQMLNLSEEEKRKEIARVYELRIEEEILNKDYGVYACNWTIYSKESYALKIKKSVKS